MKSKFIRTLRAVVGTRDFAPRIKRLEIQLEEIQVLLGKVLNRIDGVEDFGPEAEFKIFSQFGDDGLIQYLIKRIPIKKRSFVEFGVENYLESSTRFLLFNDNWTGLVLDGDARNIDQVKRSRYYWKYDLIAKQAFVTRENINDLLLKNGFQGEIGLLHIDVDGNDYWIWKEIEVVEPDIVVIEYNGNFGIDRSITIPYDPGFQRGKAHFSNLYWGSSLLALCNLATEKGYSFVGCNSGGNNAYFVKSQKVVGLNLKSVSEGFVEPRYRESLDEDGNLSFLSIQDRRTLLKGLPVYNTELNTIEQF